MATPQDVTELLYDIPGQHVYQGAVYVREQTVEVLEAFKDFQFRPEDVFVATYPKSGTTWMCEVADVVNHDADTKVAGRAPTPKRWPFMEMILPGRRNMEILTATSGPRQMKTHMAASFLAKQVREQRPKTIIVFRNPKDMVVSYYHFYRMNKIYNNFTGDFNEYFEIFKANQLNYGNYWDHVLGWWELRDLPNVEVFMYEDMLKDCAAAVRRVAKLLGKEFTDTQINDIVEYTSFDSMKNNPQTNFGFSKAMDLSISPFLRKGKVGDWKNYFNEEQSKYVDDMIKEKLGGSGIEFTFE